MSTDADLTKGARIRKLRHTLNLSQEEFGEKIARRGKRVPQNYLSKLEIGERNIGSDVQERIEKAFNVRRQWLDEGIGEMFSEKPEIAFSEKSSTRVRSILPSQSTMKIKNDQLVWVSIRERGQFLRTPEQSTTLRRFVLPLMTDGGYAFEIADNTMLPIFAPGSYVLCSKLDFPDYMLAGYPYIIQTDNQLLVAIYEKMSDEAYRFGFSNDTAEITLSADQIICVYHIEYKLAKP